MSSSEDIHVETASGTDGNGGAVHQVVINDRKGLRAWSGSGKTVSEAATEATRKFIGDRRAREYVGEP